MTDENKSIEEQLANALLRQGERSGGAPVVIGAADADTQSSIIVDDEPNKSWPMVIYILPNGDVISRRELGNNGTSKFGSTHLAARSEIVIKFTPGSLPGNSHGGQASKFEVLKFRGDIAEFMQSLTRAFLETPGNEEALLGKIFNGEVEPEEHEIGCTCIMCIPGN